MNTATQKLAAKQSGITLIESLIAMLIGSIGLLAVRVCSLMAAR